jgi:hypothetical protein
MSVSVDTGGVGGYARYVMVRQNNTSNSNMFVGEVQVLSGGINVASGKTVTAKSGLNLYGGYSASAITDGVISTSGSGFANNQSTNDTWVQIDLGGLYAIDSIKVWPMGTNTPANTNNLTVFASATDMSAQTYAALSGSSTVQNYGTTSSMTSAGQNFNNATRLSVVDTTPTFSGTLAADLGSDDVLAVYDGSTRLGTATPSGLNWSYTPSSALTVGAHTIKVQIENGTTNAVRLAQSTVVNVLAGSAPSTTTSLVSTDDVGTNSSYTGAITSNSSTDDTVLALSGVLSTGLSATERVDVYDGTTLLGSATVSGSNWTYTTSTLTPGSHSFTAQVTSTLSGLSGTPSAAVVVVENRVGGLQLAVDSGVLAGTTMTDTTPTLSGSVGAALGSADVVGVYIDGDRVGGANVTGTNWTFQVGTSGTSTALATGSHTVQIKQAPSTSPPARPLPWSPPWWPPTTLPPTAATRARLAPAAAPTTARWPSPVPLPAPWARAKWCRCLTAANTWVWPAPAAPPTAPGATPPVASPWVAITSAPRSPTQSQPPPAPAPAPRQVCPWLSTA